LAVAGHSTAEANNLPSINSTMTIQENASTIERGNTLMCN
jgi:hypothetical protein